MTTTFRFRNIEPVNEKDCVGCGTCEDVCQTGAIKVDPDIGLPKFDYTLCDGCKKCIDECVMNTLTGFLI